MISTACMSAGRLGVPVLIQSRSVCLNKQCSPRDPSDNERDETAQLVHYSWPHRTHQHPHKQTRNGRGFGAAMAKKLEQLLAGRIPAPAVNMSMRPRGTYLTKLVLMANS